MNKPLTVAHVLPQHASFSLIACRTPITQLSTPIDKHQSHGFPSGRLRNNTNSHTFRRFWRQNPGLSSSGQRIRFTECQQICLTINKYSLSNIALLFRSPNCLWNATLEYVAGKARETCYFQIPVQMIPNWGLYKSVQVDMQTSHFHIFRSSSHKVHQEPGVIAKLDHRHSSTSVNAVFPS